MKRIVFLGLLCLFFGTKAWAQGSRILAPNYGDTTSIGVPGPGNNDFAWLEHDAFGGAVDNFLDPDAPEDERLFVYLRAGETLRYGIRRIPVKLGDAPGDGNFDDFDETYSTANIEATNQDLTIMIVATDAASVSNDTIVQATHFDANTSWDGDAQLLTSNGSGTDGIIQDPTEGNLGPEFTFNTVTYNTGGYEPLEYINNTGVDQAFWIAFLQDNVTFTSESDLIDDIEDGTIADVDVRSWYDLWDFTVYDGNEEKEGRVYCRRWNFTSQYFTNRLADEFQMYIRVPSVISGADAGNYIKELDIAGLDPFSAIIYANSEGSDGAAGDTNGDGVTDFQDFRQSQVSDIGYEEYDIFLQNPDIDLWPTSTLPSVSITNAVFYCNDAGSGGEAAIGFETNQVGYAAILIDLNGIGGHQIGTEDVIIEVEITTIGSQTLRWDGLDGNGAAVPSGTPITISGRFTSGPIHVPMFDVEESAVGINMLDVRPSTSFDLIYWDDTFLGNTNASPLAELDGTNSSTHLWNIDDRLINTWSFGYYQINTENRFFTYVCDEDGDGISGAVDLDSDNDGIANSVEGDHRADNDADGIPNYLDSDFAGFTDSNGDGVDDNFDADLDGIPNALDVDSDNDGIPDMIENGQVDTDLDGTLDNGSGITDVNGNGLADEFDPACTGTGGTLTGSPVGQTNNGVANPDNAFDGDEVTFAQLVGGDADDMIFDFGTSLPSGTTINITIARVAGPGSPTMSFWESNADGSTLVNEQTHTSTVTDPTTQLLSWTLTGSTRYLYADATFGQTGIYEVEYSVPGPVSLDFVNAGPFTINGNEATIGNASDGDFSTSADMRNGDWLVADLGVEVPAGGIIKVFYASGDVGQAEDAILIGESPNDGSGAQPTPANTIVDTNDPFVDDGGVTARDDADSVSYTLTNASQFIYMEQGAGTNNPMIFELEYSYTLSATGSCPVATAMIIIDTDNDGVDDYLDLDSDDDGIVDVIEAGGDADTSNGQISGFTDSNGNGFNDLQESIALTTPDTDGDGTLFDYLDIDSDNDGILDNIDGQDSENTIATTAGDTNSNGLLDVYDPTNGGTLIVPVDTDSDGTDDYQSTDADGDGVLDFIEGWDDDLDGFSDLDSDEDGDISDETGHNVDTDSDGLWDIFDDEPEPAPVPNTDGSGKSNWQDTDDDNDGILTIGEDTGDGMGGGPDGDWSNDKTQGQGASADTPDYLYRGDYDGDAVPNATDLDSDNDGILDADEDNGETVDPSLDGDNNGIPNYQDLADAVVSGALTSLADANGDGVYDVFDTDFDGIPDFLDLDSDNDGVWDAVEANAGSVPNGLSTTTGQFTLQDPDNDGLMNYIDTDDVTMAGVSNLSNPDTDGDGIKDYLDIDSDGDGIVDIIEAQTSAGFISLSGSDTDGDGIDDAFDPSDGGVRLDPVNTDGLDLRDYLDLDSDNDDIDDIIEGDDVDQDGYGDWDANQNNTADEATYGDDTDGDGLSDLFDTVTLGTTGNEVGSNADLPNTDGIDEKNWRDSDDDNDGILSINEDADNDGNYANDQTGGQGGNVPDFLFYIDFDNDDITDASDADSDNDGILDTIEDGGTGINPSGDIDGDGILNAYDDDIDGDMIPNESDNDTDGTPGADPVQLTDTNGDGIADEFDQDLDGIPDYRDRDSDNDGVPDIVEAGGEDSDSDGIVDSMADADQDGIPDSVDVDQAPGNGGSGTDTDGDGIDDSFDADQTAGTDTDGDDILDTFDPDIDGDGLANTYDDDNGGTQLAPPDADGDGLFDYLDLDSDNDGITDLKEAGGTDTDGDGKLDDATDSDQDGFGDLIDADNGGSALPRPDSDSDGVRDYLDVDSDNDGVPDTVDNGGPDTNNDGLVDGFSSDADGDGLADVVDPDSGGTPISNVDTDGDGFDDYLDLDADNDGYPDILEAGGTDADNDGIVDRQLNSDADSDMDTVPDNVDVDNSGTNGGSGVDTDGDEIDDSFDVDQTGGNDDDGDGIDNAFDTDSDGNGFDDFAEANPYGQEDKEGDGLKDFRDLDSDGDGIVDVIELGGTVDPATGRINGFVDNVTPNGWYEISEGRPSLTLPDTDSDGFEDYRDIDADNDGLPDNIEAHTKATYVAISSIDTDNDGLDDAYDPDNGGTLPPLPATDGGDEDYLDDDSDADEVPDNIEGANDDKSQYADWDSDSDGDITDEIGHNVDTDSDGLWDVFDIVASNGPANVTGSLSDGQDSDNDGIWDFQDVDDDGDGITTANEENQSNDGDPTNDFDAGGTPIPDYLFGDPDKDGDGVNDDSDLDSDNDGLEDTREDGGTGIDPSGDEDSDGILNAFDDDLDGDGIPNEADTDADNSGSTDAVRLTDTNNDGIPDEFDTDLDGVPDFLDIDADNDGIADVVEFGLADTDEDGTLAELGSLAADANGNGLLDTYDPACDGAIVITTGYGGSVFAQQSVTDANEAIGNDDDGNNASFDTNDFIVIQLQDVVPSGTTISIDMEEFATGAGTTNAGVSDSPDGVSFSAATTFAVPEDDAISSYVLTQDAEYIRIVCTGARTLGVDYLTYTFSTTNCSGGTAITIPDNDTDGINDHLDLDSDNDGIPDNVEAQTTGGYTAPAAGDTDGDGLLNVYDEDIAVGNAIDPTNTDGPADAIPDYLDDDSDEDGVADVIEAFDSNTDGFGSWDTNADNIVSTETGFDVDIDGDGIAEVFDSSSGLGSLANITGTNAERQDTDDDGIEDWRDVNDDGDGNDTEDEDANTNGNFADDFTQGGNTIPDYLFNDDKDDDGVSDSADLDSDNDGIPDIIEFDQTRYTGTSGPFDDDDADGIFNYLDADATGFIDVNGDNVDDRVDKDRDGIPNFFDIDSDDDGIADIIEANLTDTNEDGTVDEGSFTDTNSNGLEDTYDYQCGTTGGAVAVFSQTSVNNPFNSLRTSNGGGRAGFNNTSDVLILDLGEDVVSGTDITIDSRDNFDATPNTNEMTVEQSSDGSTFSNAQSYTFATPDSDTDLSYVLSGSARYLRITMSNRIGGSILVDRVFYTRANPCTGSGTLVDIDDTDSDDSLPNFLDLDSDNDGITDNIEGFSTADYVVPSGVDADQDGLDDAYDSDFSAIYISTTPENTDGTDQPDYRDTDTDNDTSDDEVGELFDIIEGYDANRNGFSDLDLDLDGDLSDETGWNEDTDGDGIWNIFDSFAGRGVTNVLGTYADLQDTDSDGILDFRDTDDDNDALTTATEDVDNDGVWTNDKVQGGGATPDYLFFNDSDMDGIADGVDIDGDNDGIANSEEYNSATDPDPFGDEDGDGVFNYNDNNDPALSALTDTNADGVYDEYDRDLDGLPNFFDLDSDNDGIPDMVEANNGVLPDPPGTANDPNDQGQFPASSTTGDANGLFDDFDPSAAGTALDNPDTDGDGLNDALDIDSDNDGIVDLVEAGGSDFDGSGTIDGFGDTDGDGLANSVDSDNSGTALPIPNTDGIGGPNYIDRNSDEDSLWDYDEGFDDDEDGDATSLGEDYVARATAYGDPIKYPTDLSWYADFLTFGSPDYHDTDGDGLVDLFDPDDGGNWYGNVSGVPDNDFNGIPNVLDDDGGTAPLPLTWLSFDGWFESFEVKLEWKTADEDNVSHFDIEWSPDGASFTVIDQLAAANTYETINTYGYTDRRFVEGFNYYRLNQVDFDGMSEYSETILILASASPFKVMIYPNPAADYIRVEGSVPLPIGQYSMYDMSGRQVMKGNTLNVNRLDLDIRHLTTGIYQLIVETPVGTYKQKLIKK